uniref:Uncharacterized protein n=1 Tax=Anguilla anguilla TaxID=7936 RepID=A0A0E9WQ09_ANGAN
MHTCYCKAWSSGSHGTRQSQSPQKERCSFSYEVAILFFCLFYFILFTIFFVSVFLFFIDRYGKFLFSQILLLRDTFF